MVSGRVLTVAVLTVLAAGALARAAEPELATYESVKATAGRGSAANIKLALWCEAHGLPTERVKHLALAVLSDPANVTARGLMGLVAYRGKWISADRVGEAAKGDEALTARLAAYNGRRAELDRKLARTGRARLSRQEAAHGHVNLGMWCEQNDLKAEATAHFTSAVVLDPDHDATWKHLGYVKHEGRWVSAEQLAADRLESEEQRHADRTWEPRLKTWRGWLADEAKRDEALALLAKVEDPRAVPAISRILGSKGADDQVLAVELFGRIDNPPSTMRLAELAVFGKSPAVRSAAASALQGREAREYAGTLVDLIRSPMKYAVQPVSGPGAPGALLVTTPRFKMLRTYDAPPAVELSNQFYGYVGYDANGLPVVARGAELKRMSKESPLQDAGDLAGIEARTAALIGMANLKAVESQQRLIADIRAIEAINAQTASNNSRVIPVLATTLDAPAELKDDENAWQTWWNDRLGYKYEPPEQVALGVNASRHMPPPRIYSCFVAGTPVRTINGLRAIETLSAGDQVLTQNVTTGELSFESVLVVHHNAPGVTLRVALENGETLVPSIYHRFWRAGKGWALARELKPGDLLRTLAGLTKVVSVSAGPVVPVFNLDVAKTRTFFVGEHSALVHDNTLPETRLVPFDKQADLTSAR